MQLQIQSLKKECTRFWWVSTSIILGYIIFSLKQCYLLYLLSQPAERFWTALYYRPCGNYHDSVVLPIDTLNDLNKTHYAFELLDCVVKAKCAQSHWESVSHLYGKLQTIDKDGTIDPATWLQLCRPLDNRMKQIFSRCSEKSHLSNSGSEPYIAINPRGLIYGYENHKLLSDAEKWFSLLEEREEKLHGIKSFRFTQAKLDHANFYMRNNRADMAIAIVRSLQGNLDDDWVIGFKKAGNTRRYFYQRKDGKNFVKFEEPH